jgi:hypothetical protein
MNQSDPHEGKPVNGDNTHYILTRDTNATVTVRRTVPTGLERQGPPTRQQRRERERQARKLATQSTHPRHRAKPVIKRLVNGQHINAALGRLAATFRQQSDKRLAADYGLTHDSGAEE